MADVPADRILNKTSTDQVDDDLEKDQPQQRIEERHDQKKSGILAATLQGNVTTELTHFERRAALINE